MNSPVCNASQSLTDEFLQQARMLAQASGRSLATEIEALSGIEPRQVVDQLASRFHMKVMETIIYSCPTENQIQNRLHSCHRKGGGMLL